MDAIDIRIDKIKKKLLIGFTESDYVECVTFYVTDKKIHREYNVPDFVKERDNSLRMAKRKQGLD